MMYTTYNDAVIRLYTKEQLLMIKPNGIIPAIITPFKDNQSIDEVGLRFLVQRFIQQGVHGIFCLGTNGEFHMLTREDKIKVANIIVDEVAGKIPVYVGTGGISTDETIHLTREMQNIGVDAISVITPYLLTFTQDELLHHYQLVASSTSLPVVLYNIPNNTGNALHPKTVAKLSQIPNIVGIKDSSGRLDVILQYLDAVDEDFSVLAGTDSLILSTLMAGGKGAVAATANLVPQLVVSIYENWKVGNIEAAQKAQDELRPLRHSFQLGTIPSALKEAMNMSGLPAGPARFPVTSLGDNQKRELEVMLKHYLVTGTVNGS